MSLPFFLSLTKSRIDHTLPILRYALDKSFGTGSIPKFKPTSPTDRRQSTRNRGKKSPEKPLFALLSYASIDYHEVRTLSRTKNCELCGSDFECKGLLGCWCRSVDILLEQRGELSKRASDCICPNCLAGYKDRESHRSEEHTSELQSPCNLVCRLLLEKKK